MKTIIGYTVAIIFLIIAVICDVSNVNAMNADIQKQAEYFNMLNDNN